MLKLALKTILVRCGIPSLRVSDTDKVLVECRSQIKTYIHGVYKVNCGHLSNLNFGPGLHPTNFREKKK